VGFSTDVLAIPSITANCPTILHLFRDLRIRVDTRRTARVTWRFISLSQNIPNADPSLWYDTLLLCPGSTLTRLVGTAAIHILTSLRADFW
jgi:hypothetical protein